MQRISKDSPWRRQFLWILEGMKLTPSECRWIFGVVDVDQSGDIDLQEFLRGADSLSGHVRERAKSSIESFIEGEPAMKLREMEVGSTCSIVPEDGCSLRSLPRDMPSLVFPGGETRCLSTKTACLGGLSFGT